jgi:acyl-CoA synthetase (AMP-forming)/AMP-acid ligase II
MTDPADDLRVVALPTHVPTTGAFLSRLVDTYADSVLAVAPTGTLTYEEADVRSRSLAKGLVARGVGKGTRVGLLAPNGLEWIIGWLATTRIGAICVPVNTYLKPRELDRLLLHADVDTLLSVESHLANDYVERLELAIPGLADRPGTTRRQPSHPYLREIWMWGNVHRSWAGSIDELVAAGDGIEDDIIQAIEAQVTPADAMVIVYSSGSTSDPKGAIHSHGSVIRHAHNLWQFRDIRPGDAIYSPMPLFWVGGLTFTLLGAMHAGATAIFEDQFEPATTLELLERTQCTHILGWPHMVKALTDHPSFVDRDLSSIRAVGQRTVGPGFTLAHPKDVPASLGMTETLGPHTLEMEGALLSPGRVGSFGRAVPGVEHRIIDVETAEDCERGVPGELLVRGYPLMQGLNKIEREATFTPDGWYRTGDSAYLDDDDNLFYRGRLGDTIKAAGVNVSPREVEIALEAHAEVSMAFVVGVTGGDGETQVAAVVILTPGRHIEPTDLLGRVKAELANYMVPRHLMVVEDRNDLPWLESGKLDRRAAHQLLQDRYGVIS